MPKYRVSFFVSADSDAEAAAYVAGVVPEFTEVSVEQVEPYVTWGAQ